MTATSLTNNLAVGRPQFASIMSEPHFARRLKTETRRAALITGAVSSLQAGDLVAALQTAQGLVAACPRDAFARQLLGRCLKASGQYAAAAQEYRASVRLDPRQAQVHVSLGIVLRAAGDSRGAVDAYRRAIRIEPTLAIAHHNLANALQSVGDLDAARASYERVVALEPGFADAHFELGNLANGRADLGAARAHFQAAASGRLSSASAAVQVGRALSALREHDLASRAFAHACALAPNDTESLALYARSLYVLQDYEAATAVYLKLAELEPGSVDTLTSLGASLRACLRYAEAAACYERALTIRPETPVADLGLAALDWDRRRFEAAEQRLRALVERSPDYSEAWHMLTVVCRDAKRYGAALEASARALTLDPTRSQGHLNRGTVSLQAGDADGAIADFTRALTLDPDWLDAAHTSLMPLSYAQHVDQTLITARHRAFGERFFPEPARRVARPIEARRLRIGYLSPDLCAHSVSYFLAPVLSQHDRSSFEVFCYDLRGADDDTASRLRETAEHWRVLRGQTDSAVLQAIVADEIDILIDCAGHTADSRVRVIGNRCAAVQALWLGYPTTSGLPAMDYRITDVVVDPPGFDAFSTERLLRLPYSYYCYEPPPEAPPVELPPMLRNGYVTFGSFNSLVKVSDMTVALWSRVLQAVPGSRLLLKAAQLGDETIRARTLARFAAHGVESDRLEILGRLPGVAEHLGAYARVDVALDAHPYNGATTTCEALWMGVPVATLAGATHASRMGASILAAAGLREWAAPSPDEFVALCVGWADDPNALAATRSGLRAAISASPLMAAEVFTRNFESLLRATVGI
jgi:predicted O-linked N-acetylglucosamine transferase (SPINDLY family)